jgi:hypothetical protein
MSDPHDKGCLKGQALSSPHDGCGGPAPGFLKIKKLKKAAA